MNVVVVDTLTLRAVVQTNVDCIPRKRDLIVSKNFNRNPYPVVTDVIPFVFS